MQFIHTSMTRTNLNFITENFDELITFSLKQPAYSEYRKKEDYNMPVLWNEMWRLKQKIEFLCFFPPLKRKQMFTPKIRNDEI
jgi:hypothetical protein